MAKPGRKSDYDAVSPLVPGRRPDPPAELTAEEQAEWMAITSRLPANWFAAENAPMLKELCRHICYARMLAGEISALKGTIAAVKSNSDPVAPGSKASRNKVLADLQTELLSLLRAHGDQSERIGNLSTKLRLTQLSRATRTAARAASAAADAPTSCPWNDWGPGRTQQ